MDAAIPGHIDEANQPFLLVHADVGQAAVQHRLEIAPNIIRPRGVEQGVQLLVCDRRADPVADCAGYIGHMRSSLFWPAAAWYFTFFGRLFFACRAKNNLLREGTYDQHTS